MMVPGREILLEEILGRVVRTAVGRPVGRIEDVVAVPEGSDYIVKEVILADLGPRSWLYRMAAELPTLKSLGIGGRLRIRAIPWEWLDFSDPAHPRFIEAGDQR